ncbi:THAP domain-containing protein 3 [Hoplias malabaricus]|uniref:THAP domain-containing protein 3 n=1 Tax=Hoplias malabaricus TaxID=27720 RepID=UPI003461EF91
MRMTTCEACRRTMSKDLTFYKFPQEDKYFHQWRVSLGKGEGWTPSSSSVLCSAHFSPECFEGSAQLRPDAIPTVFSPAESMGMQHVEDTGNVTNDQGTSDAVSHTQRSLCECEERFQAMEKHYKLKLLTARQQIKRYEKELYEQSQKALKWQRKAIVLQCAMKASKMKKSVSSTK